MMLALLSLLFAAHATEPYRLVIVTDTESAARAQEYKDYLLRTPPYSQLGDQLDIVISQMSDVDMSCSNDMPDSPRIISCDNSKIQRRRRDLDGHHVVAFTNNGTGGAGGQVAIASLDYPLNTMLHEMLHMYGLADEYCYEGTEVGVYCNPPRTGPNVALIRPEPPYADKANALGKHASRIPWAGDISAPTPITSGTESLGTPGGDYGDSAGLYEGGNCSNKTDMPEKVYRPFQNSIMRTLSVTGIQPFYQARILEAMEGATGSRFERRPATVPSQITYAPQPQTEVIRVVAPVQTLETDGVICPPLADPVAVEGTKSLQQEIDSIYRNLLSPNSN
jgi:hypothetical protein